MITVDRKGLLAALAQVQGITSGATPEPPALAYCHASCTALGSLRLLATDLRRTYSAVLSGDGGDVGTACTFQPEPLIKVLKALSRDRVSLDFGFSGGVEVSWGTEARHKIAGLDATQYPVINLPAEGWKQYPAATITELIDHGSPGMSSNEKRPELCGMLLETVTLADKLVTVACSLDGHKLTKAESIHAWPGGRIFIPRKGIQTLQGFLPSAGLADFLVTGDWLYCRSAGQTLGIRLLPSDRFLDYMALLQPGEITVRLGLEALQGAVARLRATTEADGGILFALKPGSLTLHGEQSTSGCGAEPVVCEYTGRERTFALAGRLLAEVLQTFSAEQIDLQLQEADGEPIILQPVAPRPFYMSLLMVLRT